jgi:hypothetical protein
MQWLYTQNVVHNTITGDIDAINKHWNALIQLWILANEKFMPTLQNMTINAIDKFRKSTSTLPVNDLRLCL